MSLELATTVYNLSKNNEFSKDYSFKDQIRRAVISISSNIAEGAGSGFDKLGLRYFYNSRGSCIELDTQLIIARNVGYISEQEYLMVSAHLESVTKRLNSLINYRRKLNIS